MSKPVVSALLKVVAELDGYGSRVEQALARYKQGDEPDAAAFARIDALHAEVVAARQAIDDVIGHEEKATPMKDRIEALFAYGMQQGKNIVEGEVLIELGDVCSEHTEFHRRVAEVSMRARRHTTPLFPRALLSVAEAIGMTDGATLTEVLAELIRLRNADVARCQARRKKS